MPNMSEVSRIGRAPRAGAPVWRAEPGFPAGVDDQLVAYALAAATKIFQEYDAKRYWDRPELADGQCLDPLVSVNEAAKEIGIEPAVGMRDVSPSYAEYARQPRERTVDQLGQLFVEARRKVGTDFTNLLFDYVIVVEDPLGGRCDRAANFHRCGDGAVRIEEDFVVVGEPAS